MADGDQVIQEGEQGQKSLGWRSALPDEFKEHEWVKTFQKPGDFVKDAIGVKADRDALKTKLETDYIPKLPENATDEQKKIYYKQLGVPEEAKEYEFPEGEGIKHDEKMVNFAQTAFHDAKLTKEQAKTVGQHWDKFVQGFLKEHYERNQKSKEAAETQMKAELGAAYETRMELATRFWTKHLGKDASLTEFLTEDQKGPLGNDPRLIRLVLRLAALTGEDLSPPGTPRRGEKKTDWYPKTDFKTL